MNLRLLIAAAALAASAGVQAQTVQVQTGTSPVLEVQRLAPQLVAFAGGEANFANLVNGLAFGSPVSLTTAAAAGGTQLVNFTPSGTMTALQIAQTLEAVRQSLIARGIATPTAQQLATALVGGALPTALGTTQVNGVVATTTPLGTNTVAQQSPAVSVQGGFGAPAVGAAAAGGTAGIRSNTSDTPFPRGMSDTPPTAVPGVTTGANSAPATTGTTTAPAGLRAR